MGGWVAVKTQGPACPTVGGGMGVPTPIPDPRQGAPFDSFVLTAAPGGGREQ